MNRFRTGTGLVGIASILAVQPTWANTKPETTVEEWIAQIEQASVIRITGIEIEPTLEGLEMILEAQGQLGSPISSKTGNQLVLEIPNAVLELSEGDIFEAVSPVDGIASISATNLPENRVRLVITGANAPPQVAIATDLRGLALNVTPGVEIDSAEEVETIEVIVTAEKTPERLQDVPISLTVLAEQEIEDGDVDSFDRISDYTPNFSFFPAGANRSTSFYSMRGISNFNLSTRDAVGFFVDDVPYGFTGFIGLDLVDLERVEVLRGPQNTLYGRSSLGGVINVVTRKPTNEFEATASLSYGNYDEFQTQLSVSGPVVENELFFRLSGRYTTRDGYVENTFLDDDIDGGSYFTGRGQLLWTPSQEWEISFTTAFDDYREGATATVPVDDDPFEAELDFNGFNDLISNTQSLKIAYTHPDFRATSITTRRFSDQDGQLDADYSTADILINTTDFDSTTWTQEIRFQSPEDADRFEWLVGVYFETSDFSEDRPFINGVDSGSPGLEQIDGEFANRTLAAFGQISYRPVDPLTLTAGLRYESTLGRIDLFETTFTPTGGVPTTTLSLRDVEVEGSELLPRFVAQYEFNDNLMAYGSISRGYRPPGPNFNPFNAETAIFDGERSWNYELGLKSSWLENRLSVNLAFFHSPIENFQFPSFGPNGDFIIDTADATTTGVEIELRSSPIEGLDIIASLGFLDAEFSSGISPFTGTTLEGNKLPYTPDLTYSLAVQYRSPLGLLGRVELTGSGTTYFDDINTVKRDSFAIVNARVGYEFDNYGVYFFANNIFNEAYETGAFDSFSPAGVVSTFGAPATYGIQLKARF